MKLQLITLSVTTMLLGGCIGTGANSNSNKEIKMVETTIEQKDTILFNIDDDVDWDFPLFSLNENDDTTEKWTYNQRGLLTEYESFENSEYGKGYNSYKYDSDNKLVSSSERINTGNIHVSKRDYSYNGKIAIAEGQKQYRRVSIFPTM